MKSTRLLDVLPVLVLMCYSAPPASAQSNPPGNAFFNPILGVHKVLFIRVMYPDNRRIVLSNTQAPVHAQDLHNIFRVNSYEKLNLVIDVTPVLMMPNPTSFYELENRLSFVRIRSDAIKIAEDAGFLESEYDREIIFTVKLWPQQFNGMGGMNQRTSYMTVNRPGLSAHEVGHTIDWNHANFWRVTSANPLDPGGELIEYGDKFDIMGDTQNFHHTNPRNKLRSGWIPPESVLTVVKSDTFTVRALELSPIEGTDVSEYSALRIRRTPNSDYWLFYRSKEPLANAGAIIVQVDVRNAAKSMLLDMAPGSKPRNSDFQDAALVPGKVVVDTTHNFEIEVVEQFADSLRVRVQVGTDTLDTVPTIDILQPTYGRTVSGTVVYEATAFDPDFGNTNGAGIDTVRFIIGFPTGSDPYDHNSGLQIAVIKDLFAPPYMFEVGTDSLPDESYRLIVAARSKDGGLNNAIINHMIDNTGPSKTTSVSPNPAQLPQNSRLQQNYPNPFNPYTTITYFLENAGKVELVIYDMAGKRVRVLVDEPQTAGEHSVSWDGKGPDDVVAPSGTYFYELTKGSHRIRKKMLLLK